VPKFPSIESSKRVLFARGVGACVSGTGGIIARPDSANDVITAYYSQTGWVSSGSQTLPTSADVGVGAAFPNSGYQAADFIAGGIQVRLVAFGIRVRYIGTALNAGGVVYELEEPSHHSLEGVSLPTMRQFDSCTSNCFDGSWFESLYQPRFPADFGYTTGASGQSSFAHFLGLNIQAADDTAPFEWEVYGHWEFIGREVRGKSISHQAAIESDRIVSAVAQMPPSAKHAIASRPQLALTVSKEAMNHGASVWSKLGSGLLGGAARVGLTALGGALGGPMGAAAGSAIGYGGQMALAA